MIHRRINILLRRRGKGKRRLLSIAHSRSRVRIHFVRFARLEPRRRLAGQILDAGSGHEGGYERGILGFGGRRRSDGDGYQFRRQFVSCDGFRRGRGYGIHHGRIRG